MKRMLYIVAFTLGWSAWASAQTQTIADFARQERARRQGIKSRAVTFTNDTIKALGPATTGTAPAVAPTEAAKEDMPPANAPVRDEKYWRQALQDARDNIRRAEDQVKILELDLNRANRDYLQRSDVYNKELRIGSEINDITKRLEGARLALDAARQKLVGIEDDFRRSGAPAGWAR